MEFTNSLKELYGDYAREMGSREMYGDTQSGEQYYGMCPEYRRVKTGSNAGQIEIRIVNTRQHEVSKGRAFVSLADYAARPAAGRAKNEAQWAFDHCGVEV